MCVLYEWWPDVGKSTVPHYLILSCPVMIQQPKRNTASNRNVIRIQDHIGRNKNNIKRSKLKYID